jgi:hypothetical protein
MLVIRHMAKAASSALPQAPLTKAGKKHLQPEYATCRAVKADTLGRMVDWIVDKLTVEHWSLPEIKAVLTLS